MCTDGHEILTQHCTIYIRPSILLFYPLQVQYEHASTGHLWLNVKYTTKLLYSIFFPMSRCSFYGRNVVHGIRFYSQFNDISKEKQYMYWLQRTQDLHKYIYL